MESFFRKAEISPCAGRCSPRAGSHLSHHQWLQQIPWVWTPLICKPSQGHCWWLKLRIKSHKILSWAHRANLTGFIAFSTAIHRWHLSFLAQDCRALLSHRNKVPTTGAMLFLYTMTASANWSLYCGNQWKVKQNTSTEAKKLKMPIAGLNKQLHCTQWCKQGVFSFWISDIYFCWALSQHCKYSYLHVKIRRAKTMLKFCPLFFSKQKDICNNFFQFTAKMWSINIYITYMKIG